MTDKEKKKIELILGCVFLQIKDGPLDSAWDVYDEFEKQFKLFFDSLQEEPVDIDTQIDYQNDVIKNLNSALNSMEHNGHLPKMMTAAESLGISEEKYAKIEEEFFEEQEEPINEDLENAAIQYAGKYAPYDDAMDEVEEAFKAGAQWQKQQDNQIDKILEVNYAKGWDACKQLMIKNSIEVKVKSDKDGLFTTETWDEMNELLQKIGAKEGDMVYISIIKQEEK